MSSLRERNRLNAREVVLDAAERLLQSGETADFSMRALAAEAGVGFATPFNHFGSKNEIMRALSARLIALMAESFERRIRGGDLVDRVLAMGEIAVGLLLERPAVYKVVVGSLGVAGVGPSAVREQSRALWAKAMGDLGELTDDGRTLADQRLADQLAFTFRGCLSFWIAGEVADGQLAPTVRVSLAVAMLGFVDADGRRRLLSEAASRGDGKRRRGARNG